jgi:peptidoglycan hydrolase-like protein with peptidoglycan-binding domain
MNPTSKTIWTRAVLIFLATGTLCLSLISLGFAASPGNEKKPASLNHHDITELQESLRDKGYYHSKIDGVLGPQTRAAIRQYQQAENLPATGRLDAETAGNLGVGPESEGGDFKSSGKQVGEGGKEFGHEMKQGKPVAAGKEMGKGLGRGGKKFGEGIKKAVTPESDRGDREKKQESEKPKTAN